MGQKRIKLVDLASQEEQKKAPRGKEKKRAKKRPVVKAGKGEHGRLTDMTILPEEEKKATTKEKEEVKETTSKKKKKAKPKKVRSKRYQLLRQKVEETEKYSLKDALKLLLEISNGNFDETVEMHLLMHKKSKETEKKFPLIHKKIGKISEGEKKLLKNLQKYLESLKNQQIRKAVLTSTMSPAIKLSLEELQKTN